MNQLPLVSVVIPTYNYAHYILDALTSVFQSTYPSDRIEIIVIDDGSNDDTEQVLAPYSDRLQYHQQENQGKAVATARGISLAQGKYLFTLDADDSFYPTRIARAVEIFENDSDIVHVSHPANYLEQETGELSRESFPKELAGRKHKGKKLLERMYRRNITVGAGSTFSARTDVVKSFDIPAGVDMYIDEYLLLQSLARGDSYFFEEPLSIWRVHGENFSAYDAKSEVIIKNQLRSFDSMETVLSTLDSDTFSEKLRAIYRLKIDAAKLHAKEKRQEKTFRDIFAFCCSLLGDLPRLRTAFIPVVQRHFFLQRLVPDSLRRFFAV